MWAWINTETSIMRTLMHYVHLNNNQDYNQFRWVEYNDYTSVRSPHGDKIPPKWHGWLHKTYDDEPLPDSDSFQDPFF